ncbi:MAG: antitoxin [Gammaproteobacteria bacterium]|nr:antitoxin [Gammaproteobacteria bacterium]
MRTTLDIDESVLQALKELSRRQGRTAGAVASELIHRALSQPIAQAANSAPAGRHGFRPFSGEPEAGLAPGTLVPRVTNEQVNRLRDEAGA